MSVLCSDIQKPRHSVREGRVFISVCDRREMYKIELRSSQRDEIAQPRVARNELPWGMAAKQAQL